MVITGTPEWAAAPRVGLRARRDHAALARAARGRSSPPTSAFVGEVLDAGRRGGRRPALLEPLERAQPPVLPLAAADALQRRTPRRSRRRATPSWRARCSARSTRRPATRSSCSARWPACPEPARTRPASASSSRRCRKRPRLPAHGVDAARLRRRRRPGRRRRARPGDALAARSRTRSGSPRRASARRAGPQALGDGAEAARHVRALHRRLVRWYERPARHRRLPVHAARGRPVPDRPRHRPTSTDAYPSLRRVEGVGPGRAPAARRPAAAEPAAAAVPAPDQRPAPAARARAT